MDTQGLKITSVLCFKMNRVNNIADRSGNITLLQSGNTARKISQPIKIAQLLGSSGQSQISQRNSAVKISLPERITPYLKNTLNKKKNATNMHMKLSYSEKNVRRNLNFTKAPITVATTKKFVKVNENNSNDSSEKENSCLSRRKSLLLPPNTIKDLHLKNRFKQSRSCLLTVDSKNKYPQISEELESCSSSIKDTNAHIDSIIHERSNKTSVIQDTSSQTFNINDQSGINILHSSHSDFTDTSNETVGGKMPKNLNSDVCSSQNDSYNIATDKPQLSSACNMDIKKNIDFYNSNNVDRDNPCCTNRYSLTTCIVSETGKIKKTCSTNVEKEESLSTTTNSCEDLHSSLQTIKIISESCLNLKHSANENNEYVTVNKTELIIVASKLKHLICRLEEDVSNLKLTLATVTNILSAINVANKETDDNEAKIKQQVIENSNSNTEIMNSMNIGSPLRKPITDSINAEGDDTSKEVSKTIDVNSSKFPGVDECRENSEIQSFRQIDLSSRSNKENKGILNTPINIKQCKKPISETRRRSARLITKSLNSLNDTNDSFVNLENELDIVNVKCNTTITSSKNYTPAKNKYKNKKVGRPLKEYMALKSRMSCLLTPNTKTFNLKSQNNIHPETGEAKAALSDKILAELYHLYGDSVETQ